jgi:hypothetical protein
LSFSVSDFDLATKRVYSVFGTKPIRSSMFQPEISSLPPDVLEHHVLPFLPSPSLVSLSMVGKTWQNIASRRFHNPFTSGKRHGRAQLESMYKEGLSVEFLAWFEEHLRYPSPIHVRFPATVLETAASGK